MMHMKYKDPVATYINQTLRYVWFGSRLPKKKPPFLLVDPELLMASPDSMTDLYVYGRLSTFIRVHGVKKKSSHSRILIPVHETGNTYYVNFTSLALPIRTYVHTAYFLEAQSLEMLRIVEMVMAKNISTETFISVFPPLEKFIMQYCTSKRKRGSRDFKFSELLRLQIEEVNTMLTEAVLLADTGIDEHGRNWNIF